MVAAHISSWLHSALAAYVNRDQTHLAVSSALDAYPSLKVKTDQYTYDDGRTLLLVCIHGTLPIMYAAARYNVPINLWIPLDFPRSPPTVYVVPTGDMLVRKGRGVELDGKLEEEGGYLGGWRVKPEAHSMISLIQNMVDAFSAYPPVYANPKATVSSASTPAPRANAFSQDPRSSSQASSPQQQAPPPTYSRPPSQTHASSSPHPQHESYQQPSAQASPQRQSSYGGPPAPPIPPQSPSRASTMPAQPRSPPPPPMHPQAPWQPSHGQSWPAGSDARPQSWAAASSSSSVRPSQPVNPSQRSSSYNPSSYGPPPPIPPLPAQDGPRSPSQHQQMPIHLSASSAPLSGSHLSPSGGHLPSFIPGYAAMGDGRFGSPPSSVPPSHPSYQSYHSSHRSSAQSAHPHQSFAHQSSSPLPSSNGPFRGPTTPAPAPRPPIVDFLSSNDDAASSHTSPSAGVKTPAHGSAKPPPPPPNPETLLLHSNLHSRLSLSLSSTLGTLSTRAHQLSQIHADLESAAPAIDDEAARLRAVRDVCLGVGTRMQGVVREGEERVAGLKARGDVSVDEVVCSTTIVYNQLVDLVAEDAAISDTIYQLNRALMAEKIDVERFLKVARVLAREQFMKRALIEKICRA